MILLSSNQHKIAEILIKQFNSSWKMLERAINDVSDELWMKFENEWGYIGNIIHIIETGDFYNKNSPEKFKWGKFIDIEGKIDDRKEQINRYNNIKRNDVNRYLELIKYNIEKQLNSYNFEDFFSSDGFKEYIPTILEKYLYLLRHNMHHIGELNKTLRDNSEKRIVWL